MCKLETAIKDYADEMKTKKKLDWFPLQMYDILEETIPHHLVVKLGEIIIKNKGVGK